MSTEQRRPKDEKKLTRGWEAIAGEVGVDVKTVKKFAARADRPLPVRRDHLGFYLEHDARDAWMEGEDQSYQDYLAAQIPKAS